MTFRCTIYRQDERVRQGAGLELHARGLPHFSRSHHQPRVTKYARAASLFVSHRPLKVAVPATGDCVKQEAQRKCGGKEIGRQGRVLKTGDAWRMTSEHRHWLLQSLTKNFAPLPSRQLKREPVKRKTNRGHYYTEQRCIATYIYCPVQGY